MIKILCTLDLPDDLCEVVAKALPECELYHLTTLEGVDESSLEAISVIWTYGHDLKDFLPLLPNLKWIHIGQSGMEHLPFDAIAERGILLTHSAGINAVMIAEYVTGMIIDLSHRFAGFRKAQHNHHWDTELQQEEIYGKHVGLVGLGAAGRATAARLKACGMIVHGFDIVDECKLDTIDHYALSSSLLDHVGELDYCVGLVPLTDETHHLFNRDFFDQMRSSACLIHVSRGAVLDIDALVEALG